LPPDGFGEDLPPSVHTYTEMEALVEKKPQGILYRGFVHMNGLIRVFPRRSKQYTPDDDYVFVGLPPLSYFIPEHREVHICKQEKGD